MLSAKNQRASFKMDSEPLLVMFYSVLFYVLSTLYTLYIQLLLVNWTLASTAAPPAVLRRLCARSVTVICVVVSAVSALDLSEQFTPPETAPPALVNLIQAIEKRGMPVSTSHRICPSRSLAPSVRLPVFPSMCDCLPPRHPPLALTPAFAQGQTYRHASADSHTDVEKRSDVHAHTPFQSAYSQT